MLHCDLVGQALGHGRVKLSRWEQLTFLSTAHSFWKTKVLKAKCRCGWLFRENLIMTLKSQDSLLGSFRHCRCQSQV